ncbi:von Willebrand factor A domain-containing protein 5A-like isoform X3 [Numida meleagris]|uniref:von Willebrand factor A domain-containing protein 5A-like isoform X3 n=1 Tax=Numida meleagris TaxID=8996 RepID=UPI000B3DEE8E|nr:von Willebrand factor A domain-containing protein 5A-like isoform X3 [Numida meleagris]
MADNLHRCPGERCQGSSIQKSFTDTEWSPSRVAPGSFLLGKEFHIPLCPLPLCTAVVDVAIQDYVADVVTELIYHNESLSSSEVTFVFPLGPRMAIYSFQACSEDAKVKAVLQDENQRLHEATGEQENFEYLQYETEKSGEVFACFLGSLSPGKEMVVTLRYVQELSRKPDGAAQFVLPSTLHPYQTHYTCNCRTGKLHYSLLLTASLQSPRGVASVQASCALTPLIYTAQDHSTAQATLLQVSLAGTPPNHHLELLVYYGEPTAVSVVVEKGDPAATSGSLFGDSLLLVTLAPSIPDAKPGQRQSGEFIFLLDSTLLEHAQYCPRPACCVLPQDLLLFLLKSLPLGCYFNIYCYGATPVGIYPQSVEYTQDNVNEAMQLIPTTGSRLGDTDLLGTLRTIYSTPRPCGHARQGPAVHILWSLCKGSPLMSPVSQLFIFMSGLPPDKEAIAAEVCRHRNSHRCFSFCFSTDSATLATALARETNGEAVYVSSDNATVQVLKCLKQALKPVAEGISLDWTLPSGLEVEVLGGTPQFIFQGQHIFLYAQTHGKEQDMKEANGVMTLQFNLDGQDVIHKIQFPLCPQGDGRLAGHRLAARYLLEKLLPEVVRGSGDEPMQRAIEISLTSGIICPFTSCVGVRTSRRVPWYHGPLALLSPRQSFVPCKIFELHGTSSGSSCFAKTIWTPPSWLTTVQESWIAIKHLTNGIATLLQHGAHKEVPKQPRPSISSLKYVDSTRFVLCSPILGPWMSKAIAECRELVALQNVDGSWTLSSGLASVLQVDEAEIKGKMPCEVTEPSFWATVLAVTWLQRHNRCYHELCDLLGAKAVTWLCSRAVSQLDKCLEASNTLLGSSVNPSVFRL